MNLALVWAGKEWRSQRGLLGAYLGLVFAALMLGFLLAPGSWWVLDGNRAWTLGWFVAAGSVGVLAFAAPQLVRGELGSKDDQFVRRLPGALGPAFAGKMLFLLLASAALPLLGLAVGELFFAATGRQWDDLFCVSKITNEPAIAWPLTFVAGAAALLLGPWVAVFAWWMPGARMAVGTTAVVAFSLALGAWTALTACPGLCATLPYGPWVAYSVALALVVGWIGFVRGRRGGGALRSAKLGALAFALGLVPPATWFWSWLDAYHHPLPMVGRLNLYGLSPDRRFALAVVAGHADWFWGVPVRIDLATGAASQLGGTRSWLRDGNGQQCLGPAIRRCWWLIDGDQKEMLDLATGACSPTSPSDLSGAMRAEAPFRAPGNRRAWLFEGELHVEALDARERTFAWPRQRACWLRDVGHGVEALGEHFDYFDLTRLQPVELPQKTQWAFAWNGLWFVQGQHNTWSVFDPATRTVEQRPELQNARVVCLLDDDQILIHRSGRGRCSDMASYRPADRSIAPIELPANAQDMGGWLVRETRRIGDRVLVRSRDVVPHDQPSRCESWWFIEPATRHATEFLARTSTDGPLSELAFVDLDGDRALIAVEDQRRLVRIDLATRTTTVLFPRAGAR